MDDLNIVYNLNERIDQLRTKIEHLMTKDVVRGIGPNNVTTKRIDKLNKLINQLQCQRHNELRRLYTNPDRRPKTSRVTIPRTRITAHEGLGITKMKIRRNRTTLRMTPTWFKLDNEQKALKNIVYPTDVIKQRPFNTVARYRVIIGKQNDFGLHLLNVSDTSTETLVLALDAFAQQFGGDLSFTNEALSFDDGAYRAACGVINLGNIHLLATNYVPTARFSFIVDLDYDKDLAKSSDTMIDFVTSFSRAIAQTLSCQDNYVRIFSIDKLPNQSNTAAVTFGVTKPNQQETEQLAQVLQSQARFGFDQDKVLRHVKPAEYKYRWATMLSYLQLRPSDFAPKFNKDYRQAGLPKRKKCGSHSYYLPIGWYRHGLNVADKYPDDTDWLGCSNKENGWPIAFHGTLAGAVSGITRQGLLINTGRVDAMWQEAIRQMGSDADQPGLYLATHCDGGVHPQYTKAFLPQTSGQQSKTFRLAFQCRVRPHKFTIHKAPVMTGYAWRFVDPEAIRPYGILLKEEETPEEQPKTPSRSNSSDTWPSD